MLKHSLHIITAYIIIAIWAVSGAFDIYADKYQIFPQKYDGTMMPYDFEAEEALPVTPDTLTPFYFDYLARHGARYLSSSKKVDDIRQDIYHFGNIYGISARGKEFLNLLDKVEAVTRGRWGALSALGQREEQHLGALAATRLAGVFSAASEVNAISTAVPRVVMSMYEYCHSLNSYTLSQLNIHTTSGPVNNDLLRFFDTNPDYHNFITDGDWKEVEREFIYSNIPIQPAASLFKNGDKINDDVLKNITLKMYGVLQSLRAASLTPPDSRWMSVDEYKMCWEESNLDHYLRRSPNSLSTLAALAATPLIENIIDCADFAVLAQKEGESSCCASLRFAHAETLMPVVATLGLPTASDYSAARKAPVLDYDTLEEEWEDWWVSPLGANIQIILYKSVTDRAYALVRLNGHNIPALRDGRLLIPWSELKSFWLHRLNSFKSPG